MGKNDCNNNHDVGCRGCETTIYIPNWFSKECCEELVGHKISDEDFEKFIAYSQNSDAAAVSKLVRESLQDYFG